MCRNIKILYNFDPPTSEDEIHAAALQFVRKVSGFHEPSYVNKQAFNLSVDEISHITRRLLGSLQTQSKPRNREVEATKAHSRAVRRFGSNS